MLMYSHVPVCVSGKKKISGKKLSELMKSDTNWCDVAEFDQFDNAFKIIVSCVFKWFSSKWNTRRLHNIAPV